jgi:integrase
MSDEKNKPGRPRTGTIVKTRDGRLQAIISLPGGGRKRLPAFPRGTSEAMAREKAAFYTEQAFELGIGRPAAKTDELADTDTPMARWLKAWVADRDARGHSSTRENLSHYRLHIEPSIGPGHVQDWTKDTLRKLSADLDAKVQAGDMAWKMAGNVWGTAIKMVDDAAASKLDTIKCRDDNPATGVRGPYRGNEIGKQFLYPSEFLQFVTCQEVPLEWRRLVAVAAYTYMRDGELRVLRSSAVDPQHMVIKVTEAADRLGGAAKATKSKRARPVPIELTLLPLLEAILAGSAGGRLLSLPTHMSRTFRRWLVVAGVSRRELHHESPTTRPIRFHDLRATGITWMAVRGDDPLRIMQRAGHENFETTQAYLRLADALRVGFGDVFPALPPELFERVLIADSDHAAVSSEDDSVSGAGHEARTRDLKLGKLALYQLS